MSYCKGFYHSNPYLYIYTIYMYCFKAMQCLKIWFLEIQLLLQTTCIVLKPPLLKIHDRGHYAYVDIVEELLKQE